MRDIIICTKCNHLYMNRKNGKCPNCNINTVKNGEYFEDFVDNAIYGNGTSFYRFKRRLDNKN